MKFLVAVAAFFLATFSVASGQTTTTPSPPTSINVTFHVWIGDDITVRYHSSAITVKWWFVLFHALNSAERQNRLFDWNMDSDRIWIEKLGRYSANSDRIWHLFELDEAPQTASPPGFNELTALTDIETPVNDGKHYLLWLRTNDLIAGNRVYVHVWIGDFIITSYQMRVDLPENAALTLQNVLVQAQSVSTGFSFEVYQRGRDTLLSSVGGYSRDPARDFEWYVFETGAAPQVSDAPQADDLISGDVFQTIQNRKHYLLWWRTEVPRRRIRDM